MKTIKMLGISLAMMGAATMAHAEHHMGGHKMDGKMHKEHMMKHDKKNCDKASKLQDKTGGSGNLDKWTYKKGMMMDGGEGMSKLPHLQFKANDEVM